jgi:hypothetical protein
MNPECIDQWFPVEQQHKYISRLIDLTRRRFGLTRRRAECFVRLWVYLLLKQQQELGKRLRQPLTQLHLPEGFVPCTLREADVVFYSHRERGSERAAGMMIDRLVALGLIEKHFDGNTICIQIRSLPALRNSLQPTETAQLKIDAFDPETDAVPVANFLAGNYRWMNKNTAASHKITRLLRDWAEQYPTGMRVLRRCDNFHAVGFYVLYPTARESEKKFFLPPSKSLHLSSASEIDPIVMAIPGDSCCTSVFVRSWMIDAPYMQRVNISRFLEDVQATLIRMQADFPKLRDLYALVIHPSYEELSQALRFQKLGQDPQLPVYWVYKPVKQFLALNVEEAVSNLELAVSCVEI